MDYTKINSELAAEYSRRRINAEATAAKNREKALSSKPYAELDGLERDLVFEIGKLGGAQKKSAELKKTLKATRDAKALVLKSLNLTEADLVPKYACTKCKDTGFVGTIVCDCFERARNERIVAESGFLPNPEITFEKFSEKVAGDQNQSENLKKLKDKLLTWSNKFPKTAKKNIVMLGDIGVGKTFASTCVANQIKNNGFSVCFVSAFKMNELFLKYHTTFDKTKQSILSPLTKSDLLVVDDLGTEPKLNNVTVNYLYLIISERDNSGKSTIITTNLTPSEINSKYDERIYSRLFDKQKSLNISIKGADLRKK